jgi:polyisoprenoid-binding protein YceI
MKKFLAVAGLAFALAVPALAGTSTWNIDSYHANAQFLVKHLGISTVQGDFTKVTGVVMLDDTDITKSTVSVTIDAASVDTRVSRRDDDLKSPNFFDVAKYPNITFQSTKIEKAGEGKLKVTGNLTIKDVTKEVTLDVTGPTAPITAMGNQRRGVSATTKINRQDFHVSADPGMVGDDISILIDFEMAPPPPPKQ